MEEDSLNGQDQQIDINDDKSLVDLLLFDSPKLDYVPMAEEYDKKLDSILHTPNYVNVSPLFLHKLAKQQVILSDQFDVRKRSENELKEPTPEISFDSNDTNGIDSFITQV